MSFEQPARQQSGAGTVDWDAFFEHPPNGVIPLVSTAKSATALKQCSVLVVESLFTRDSDAPKRKAFLDILSTVIPPSGAEPHIIEMSKEQLVEIFQTIKDDRKARAQAYTEEKAQELTEANERRTLHTNYDSADLDFDSDEDWNDVFGDSDSDALDDDLLGIIDSTVSLTELDMSADMGADTTAEAPPAPPPAAPAKKTATKNADGPPPDTSGMSLDDLIQEDDSDREFCEQFGRLMKEKLLALRLEATDASIKTACDPPPFLLSPDFADHFAKVVATDIAPDVAQQVVSISRNAGMLPSAEERAAKIREELTADSNASALWGAWQTAWKRRTRQQDQPEKPTQAFKPKKKTGGLSLLDRLQGKKEKPDNSEALWQKALKQHRADNRKAQKIWEKFTAESDLYLAPRDEDNQFLMDVFAHDVTALEKDVKALYQIISQGSEAGRGFDTYRRNRHPDLAVLITVCCHPDQFIKGVENKLKAMLRAYRKADLPKYMPLTARFLGDHLK